MHQSGFAQGWPQGQIKHTGSGYGNDGVDQRSHRADLRPDFRGFLGNA